MLSVLIFYIIGILLQKNLSYFSFQFLFSFCLLWCLWAILSYKAGCNFTGVYLLIIFLLLGMMNTAYQSKPQGSNHIYYFRANSGLLMGTVLEARLRQDGGCQEILLAAQNIQHNDKCYQVEGKVLLRVYQNGTNFQFQYGDLIKAKVVLGEPDLPGNFGEFNYRDYLIRQRIFVIGSLNADQIYFVGKNNQLILSKALNYIKENIAKNIDRIYHYPQAAFIKAIIAGDRSELPPEWEPIFQDAGVMHILAISGLHVGIIATFLFNIFNFWSFFKKNERLKYIIIIIILLVYAAITGFRPSVSRATLMFITFLIAKYINRPYHQYSSIFLAALLILFYQPLLLFDAGFLLSFTVTFFIILLYPLLQEKLDFLPNYLSESLAISLSAWLGMAPLSAYYFYKISLIAIWANLIIVPLVSIILILGLISIIGSFLLISFAQLTAHLSEILINLLLSFTKFFSSLPYAYHYIAQPHIYQTISYYFLLIVMAYILINWPKLDVNKRKFVFWGTMAVIIAMLSAHLFPFSQLFSLHFINVGQGDSILIETPLNKKILIDGGGTPFNDFDVGKHTVVPYLRRLGINQIDILVLTHPDLDHLEGLVTVLKEMKVGMVMDSGIDSKDPVYQQFLSLIRSDNGIIYSKVKAGDLIALEPGLEILILNPMNPSTYYQENDFNNQSIVLKLRYKNVSFLLTGDIEESAEINLLSWQEQLKSDVLKVAHHGSITSSSKLFLNRVQPKVAIISVGLNNFNLPHPSVVKRLKDYCWEVFRTDLNGTVLITSNGQNINIKTFR